MHNYKFELSMLGLFICGIIIGIVAIIKDSHNKTSHPYFVVTDMVQCKENICNAVLDMGDIAILVPFDSTKVSVGDTLYIKK